MRTWSFAPRRRSRPHRRLPARPPSGPPPPAPKAPLSKADAEALVRDSNGRPGPGTNVGHAEDHIPAAGATDAEAKALAESRPTKANTTTFRTRRHPLQILRGSDVLQKARLAAHDERARRRDARDQPALHQHGQVEATAVPAHQLWRLAFNQLKEFLDDGGFIVACLTQRPNSDLVGALAHHAGDGADALQVMRQKLAAVFLPLLRERPEPDLVIAQAGGQVMQTTYSVDIRNGFDVED